MTVGDVLRQLCARPGELLVRQWNWKSALLSSTMRAGIFFASTLTAGWRAATGAMAAEFLYRSATSGFYGAITQAFREAEPEWEAGIVVVFLLPVLSHSLELAMHSLRGTPHLGRSLAASVCFTVISTRFNLFAMRRGALVVGAGAGSVGCDLRRMPRMIGEFVVAGLLLRPR